MVNMEVILVGFHPLLNLMTKFGYLDELCDCKVSKKIRPWACTIKLFRP
jgi:hypothetical protein